MMPTSAVPAAVIIQVLESIRQPGLDNENNLTYHWYTRWDQFKGLFK
ncbi:MAG: hypothetical protein JXA06_11645 [Bacteroidetes bacterium]|nr:hypothetical protein [Bacteroidota bacterium]